MSDNLEIVQLRLINSTDFLATNQIWETVHWIKKNIVIVILGYFLVHFIWII